MCSPPSGPSRSTERGSASLAGLALLAAVVTAFLAAPQPPVPRAGGTFDVTRYLVELDLNLESGTITGREQIDAVVHDSAAELVLDSGGLVVDSVELDGTARVPFTQRTQRLFVTLPSPSPRDGRVRLGLTYHGAPRTGLTLLAGSAQAYTTFSTSQWMVAVDAPADRAALHLQVTMPAGWRAAASGREVSRRVVDGRLVMNWWQDREVPSYTFGFVAGDLAEVTAPRGAVTLRYLGHGFSEDELRQIFRETPAMLDFFVDRAGVNYLDDAYSQALVATSGGQELAGLSHMSEAYGRSVLADATATSLIAHELAHQWWGNTVTNRDWTHFWLNEGFATFMAAAYKESARGREAYLNDVDGWRRRVDQLRAAGHDRPLVFPDWIRPTPDDRAVVYQKGALVLHELRELLGDAPFWTAVRAYTREHVGRDVTSPDLQRAFEASSGRNLSAFFAERVFPR